MGRMKRELIEQEDHALRTARLADLLAGRIGVACMCNRCGHRAEAPVALLVRQLGPDFPVPEIGARMRCGSCGSKDVATRPAWAGERAAPHVAAPHVAAPQVAVPQVAVPQVAVG